MINIFAGKAAPSSVDEVLTAFNAMIGDLMAVQTSKTDFANAKYAESTAALHAADDASKEAERASSVIKKIENLLA